MQESTEPNRKKPDLKIEHDPEIDLSDGCKKIIQELFFCNQAVRAFCKKSKNYKKILEAYFDGIDLSNINQKQELMGEISCAANFAKIIELIDNFTNQGSLMRMTTKAWTFFTSYTSDENCFWYYLLQFRDEVAAKINIEPAEQIGNSP